MESSKPTGMHYLVALAIIAGLVGLIVGLRSTAWDWLGNALLVVLMLPTMGFLAFRMIQSLRLASRSIGYRVVRFGIFSFVLISACIVLASLLVPQYAWLGQMRPYANLVFLAGVIFMHRGIS